MQGVEEERTKKEPGHETLLSLIQNAQEIWENEREVLAQKLNCYVQVQQFLNLFGEIGTLMEKGGGRASREIRTVAFGRMVLGNLPDGTPCFCWEWEEGKDFPNIEDVVSSHRFSSLAMVFPLEGGAIFTLEDEVSLPPEMVDMEIVVNKTVVEIDRKWGNEITRRLVGKRTLQCPDGRQKEDVLERKEKYKW